MRKSMVDPAGVDRSGLDRLEVAYREFGPSLWRAIYAYSGGLRDVADDAVAEAFARSARHNAEIRSLRPWVFTVAFRIATEELRRRTNLRPLAGGTSERTEQGALLGSEVELMELVRKLSPPQRAVFVLREIFGLTSRETARLLHMSEGAVRFSLFAARRRLRVELEEADKA